MTQEQKKRIRQLRATGEGYKRISALLDIPVGTVKSFCRRSESDTPAITGNDAAVQSESTSEKPVCLRCGKPVVRIPGRKKRRFCSEACRVAYWRTMAHSDGERTLCAGCGKPLQGHDRRRKFCSHTCYIHIRFAAQRGGGNAQHGESNMFAAPHT